MFRFTLGCLLATFACIFVVCAAQWLPPPHPSGKHLDVHVVAGTHDDVGWVLTPEQYYEQQVRNILDTTVEAVSKSPKRKFMYVEMYFFEKWWTDPRTTDIQRSTLRKLIATGQWEFVMGGWVMPDEATTTFSANIDQLTQGHIFLNKTFGITPSVGWQIDPFGASNALASHYKMAGFKHHIIDRINYKVHDQLVDQQAMEFIWKPSAARPGETIFTHILDENYCQPLGSGFDFEGDTWNNPPVTDENIKQRAWDYSIQIRNREPIWRTKHVLILHQCDFKYQNASLQFDNMDKIIDHIQANPDMFNMTIRWSTLAEYFKAVDAEPTSIWPVRGPQDFFPYDDNEESWWAGYFTSRQELKGLVRESEAELRVADLLSVSMSIKFPHLVSGLPTALDSLHRAVSILQHHDAITGTEKEFVAVDYANTLWNSRSESTQFIQNALNTLAGGTPQSNPQFSNSTLALQKLAPGGSVTVLAFNSLFTARKSVIKIPVWSLDVVPTAPISLSYEVLPNMGDDLRISPATLFVNVQVPAAGFIAIKVNRPVNGVAASKVSGAADSRISNEFMSIQVSPVTGLITNITLFANNQISFAVNQDILAYPSFEGPGQASGAYIFRPAGPAMPIHSTPPKVTVRVTPFVQELHQEFSSFAKQILRLYKGHNYVELESTYGTIPGNTEVISRWNTALNTAMGEIWTDNNGWSIHHREYDANDTLSIPANYYPSVYASYLQDQAKGIQFAILSDRSHGVSSQLAGSIEVMMHRRTLQDDARGVYEPLDDETIVYPRQRLVISDNQAEANYLRYQYHQELNFPVALYYSPVPDYERRFKSSWTVAPQSMDNLAVFVRLIDESTKNVLIRVANLFSSTEDGGSPVLFYPGSLIAGSWCKVVQTSATGMHVYSTDVTSAVIQPRDILTFILYPCA